MIKRGWCQKETPWLTFRPCWFIQLSSLGGYSGFYTQKHEASLNLDCCITWIYLGTRTRTCDTQAHDKWRRPCVRWILRARSQADATGAFVWRMQVGVKDDWETVEGLQSLTKSRVSPHGQHTDVWHVRVMTGCNENGWELLFCESFPSQSPKYLLSQKIADCN